MADDKDKEKQKQATKKSNGRVFDVRRPGKAPASPTSRPVIMGHKPEAQAAQTAVSGVGEASPTLTRRKIQITPTGDVEAVEVGTSADNEPATPVEPHAADVSEKDKEALAVVALDAVAAPPELAEEKPEEPEEKTERAMLFTRPKLTIEPPKAGEDVEEPKPAAEPTKELEAGEKTETETETEPKATEQQPTTTEEPPTPSVTEETALVDDEQKKTAEVGGEEEKEEQHKPEPNIEPLFNDSGVIVSHHSHHKRHHGLKVFALLLLILLLALATLDILLDLEILDLPGVPHTDFLTDY